jgi:hypothetical protein
MARISGVTMPARLKTIRINLVEEKGWKPYDSAGDIMIWASDNAHEELSHMERNDCRDLVEDLIGGRKLVQTGPKEWSPRGITVSDEDLDAICDGIDNVIPDLELTQQAILDALTWSWEIAFMPSDSDIEHAVELAKEEMPDYFDLDDDLWEPLLEAPKNAWGARSIVHHLVGPVVYERDGNHYERYIKFNINGTAPVLELHEAARKDPERTVEGTIRYLEQELASLSASFVSVFFTKLQNVMKDVDASNRTDFRKQWKQILSDADHIRHIRSEIAAFIRGQKGRAEGTPP